MNKFVEYSLHLFIFNYLLQYRVIHYANFRSNRTPHHLYILLKQGEPGMCFNMKGGFNLPTDLIFLA